MFETLLYLGMCFQSKLSCSWTYSSNLDFSFAFSVVFEAKITSRNIGELNIEYGFDVQAIYKVRNIIGIINL